MTFEEFNQLETEQAITELMRCCGSSFWSRHICKGRPFQSLEQIYESSAEIETHMAERDWLEAFSHHPRIGDIDSLREKFAATADWSSNEQQAVGQATDAVLHALQELNDRYFEKYGFIFIICATGKPAQEILGSLRVRIINDRETELKNAAAEQAKITRIRLEKLFS